MLRRFLARNLRKINQMQPKIKLLKNLSLEYMPPTRYPFVKGNELPNLFCYIWELPDVVGVVDGQQNAVANMLHKTYSLNEHAMSQVECANLLWAN